MDRWVMHVDMDAFFASVEQRDHPELRGRPVAVAGPADQRGVVCAASYEARKFGVRSAMPTAAAIHLCPRLIVVPPDHRRYARVSEEVMALFCRLTPLVEPLSLDEAFLDLTGTVKSRLQAVELGRRVQDEVRSAVQLTCSVGLGPNKLIAKIASDFRKPAGLTVVEQNEVLDFLAPLGVRSLWGVGEKTARRLNEMGIMSVAQLREMSLERLEKLFGVYGHQLYAQARGRDDRAVQPVRKIQSIGREVTFPRDIGDGEILKGEIAVLAQDVARALRSKGYLAAHLTLKIKFYNFKLITRGKRLAEPTCLAGELASVTVALLNQSWTGTPVRLIGISCGKLIPVDRVQLSLFTGERERKMRLAKVGDDVTRKTGVKVLPAAEWLAKGYQDGK
ncbi:DNA polymerase IV [Desulforudis sp. 1031]|uniref:DNA polymerase IV n=1 Tax=unclassified Candidatus Desulforudis TaxID=2635950 RepID=UPI003BBBADFC